MYLSNIHGTVTLIVSKLLLRRRCNNDRDGHTGERCANSTLKHRDQRCYDVHHVTSWFLILFLNTLHHACITTGDEYKMQIYANVVLRKTAAKESQFYRNTARQSMAYGIMLRGSNGINASLMLVLAKWMVSECETGQDRMGLIILKNELMQKITLNRKECWGEKLLKGLNTSTYCIRRQKKKKNMQISFKPQNF